VTGGGLLVVTAHPDDEVLIAGGVLAACAGAGAETGVVCLTRGEQGPIADSTLATHETLGDVRERELQTACAALGVGWVQCLRHADGWLPWNDEAPAIQDIGRAIAERAPAAVVTFGDDGLYWHPDHVAVHRFTTAALASAGDGAGSGFPVLYEAVWLTSAMPELTAAMADRGLATDLWDLDPDAFGVADSEGLVEIDVTPFVEQKLRALRAHATQLGPDNVFSQIPPDLAERFLGVERFRPVGAGLARTWLATTAAAGRAP
jgi:N-acetyl-1-D-myo-inositol-2-amino-2-deoxy-alpha-D-glucopyranoside deacetylase